MKLRSITLQNVRRFAGRQVQIGEFSDGLNTVCEPNESGKSTFFEALHALLFIEHKSTSQEIKALQPTAGGAVHVTTEVDIGGRRHRIAKTYLSSKKATVTDVASGRVLLQEGEAEAWIAETIGRGTAGPAGLLWMRQGVSGFGPEGGGAGEKKERDRLRDERRELMSMVAGQIDMVTGGRRMDRIMRRCVEELETLVTPAHFRPKSSGPWGAQVKEVEELEARRKELQAQLKTLGDTLGRKAELTRRVATLIDPAVAAKRETELVEARTAFEDAKRHAEQLVAAEQALRLVELEASEPRAWLKQAEQDAGARLDLSGRIERLARSEGTADVEIAEIREQVAIAEAALKAAEHSRDEAVSAVRAERRAADLARQRRDLGTAHAALKTLTGFETERVAAEKIVREAPLSDRDLATIEAIETRRLAAQAAREAGAPSVMVTYDGATRLSVAGREVEGGIRHPVLTEQVMDVPGIGRLTIAPGLVAGRGGEVDDLARQIARQLAERGITSLADAREAVAQAAAAAAKAALLQARIETVAHKGTDVLRNQVRDLAAALGIDPDALGDDASLMAEDGGSPTGAAKLEEAADAAEVALRNAQGTLDGVKRRESASATALAEARTSLRLAREELDRAPAEPDPAVIEATRKRLAEAETRAETARAELEAKRTASPDLGFAEATVERLESARANDQAALQKVRDELMILEGVIATRADQSIEATLAEVEGALERAQSRAGRFEADALALKALREALDGARSQAREAYFEPVKREMAPLIRALHGNAEFELDDGTMLMSRLERGGESTPVENLSVGAAEQIAILTRLAFAKLYLKGGQHIPIILDDPLGNTDDARIKTMFSLLTQVAREQQIIVLSCHDGAFGHLGGRRLQIESAALAA